MAFNIQIFNTKSSDFTQVVELDEILVTIRLKFNVRNESWYISLETENNSVKDLRLSINFPILRQHKALMSDIAGDFFVQKVNETAVDNLTYSNLGVDYLLLYYTAAEVTSWFSDNNIL